MKSIRLLIIEAQLALVALADRAEASFPPTDQVVELALRFTKKNPSERDMAGMMAFYENTVECPALANEHMLSMFVSLSLNEDPEYRQRAANWWEENASHRRKFRRLLEKLLNDPEKAVLRYDNYIETVKNDMLIVCRFDDDGELKQQYFPFSIEAVYHFVMMMLTSPTNYRWERLGRCARDDCGTYFLRPIAKGTPGGQPRKYCTSECQLAVNRSEASERMKRKRERDRK